jgi:hypothetical protein
MSASMVATASVVRACSPSRLAGRDARKTLPLTYPRTEKFSGVGSGDRGGQAIVPRNRLPMGHLPRDMRKPHWTYLQIKLKHILQFVIYVIML